MFTGLVETMGTVARMVEAGPAKKLFIRSELIADGAEVGDSVAINGCCLTIVSVAKHEMEFEAGEETLSRTNLGHLTTGSSVNLERSLKVGDRLGGHFVTGHVDSLGELDERIDDEDWSTCWFRVPAPLTRQMARKGSVAVDGISLTLVDVQQDRFSVALIPHTLKVTTLGNRKPGDAVNIETDVLAKYVEQQWLQVDRQSHS